MKKCSLIFLFIMLLQNINAQYFICDTLRDFRNVPFDADGIQSTRDYIKVYHPKERSLISDRSKLIKLLTIVNKDSLIIIGEEGPKFEIELGNKVFASDTFFEPKEDFEPYSLSINEDIAPYGINSLDNKVNYIKQIKVNSILAPKKCYSDLLNPNQYETFFSIKPIEAYLSKDGLYIYLYIFGKINSEKLEYFHAKYLSYMAKLIFTSKGYYVGRIVERGSNLIYFGFGECPEFIGF